MELLNKAMQAGEFGANLMMRFPLESLIVLAIGTVAIFTYAAIKMFQEAK